MEQILDQQDEFINLDENSYAGFWIRFGAIFIDGLILFAIQNIVSFIIAGTFTFGNFNGVVYTINLVIGVLYFAFMESSQYQATFGKLACNLKVVDLQGQRISFSRAIGRYLAKFISYLTLFIGFIMAVYDKKKQALHDKIAGTYVLLK